MNKNSSHPSSVLKQKFTDIIRDSASKAEKDGRLTKAQMGLIYEQNWFKLLAPSAYGGLQLPLPDALTMQEALAWADGSTGWLITHCANSAWECGFIDPELAKEVLGGEKVCFAGITGSNGTAEKTENGYVINGRWSYAAAAHDATAFAVHCTVTHNGAPVTEGDRSLSFLLLKSEVTVGSNWNAMGLIATASQNFEARNVAIPANRGFKTGSGNSKVTARLYQYPFQQMNEAAMALNISGMAIHFLDLCETIFAQTKNRRGEPISMDNAVQDTYDKTTAKMEDARTKLFYAVELTWQACMNHQQIKETVLYKVSSAAFELAKRARECVDALYPFCGLAAVDKGAEINRVWRDLHTACQNGLLVFGEM